MSIDTLTPGSEAGNTSAAATPPYTAAVRTYIERGVEQVDDSIAIAERHLAELDRRRDDVVAQFAAARSDAVKHLEGLVRSRAQLVGFLGDQPQDDDSVRELPTFVCPCGRIAVLDPERGPIHDANGTHVPAGDGCRMPILGDLNAGQDRAAAAGEASAA